MHLMITGERSAGKSYLLKTLMKELDIRPYGFITLKKRVNGKEYVFIHDARTPIRERSHTDANCGGECGCRPPNTNPEAFDRAAALLKDIPAGSYVLLDEIGFMESSSPEFCQAIRDVLNGPYTAIGVIKLMQNYKGFLNEVVEHPRVHLITLTKETRREKLLEALDFAKNGFGEQA